MKWEINFEGWYIEAENQEEALKKAEEKLERGEIPEIKEIWEL